ncbi:MAG: NmrA family NAD(P)-binding protein [Caldilineales bacterium]|nr:NmrA family NAD(P)-binding protein [Caldilineales bacterium]
MILITGAAGKTGRAVTAALAQRDARVRAFVRHSQQVGSALEAGAVETVVGGIEDESDLRAALAGVESVYHICPNMHPHEREVGGKVVEAAKAAGVRHFVYHSVLHPQTKSMPHHWQKLRVEELLFESGIPFTILQPTAYMQNILVHRQSILHDGIYPVPYAVGARISLVDLSDVAEAAAIVLTQPGHDGAIYELAGIAPLSQAQVTETIQVSTGHIVTATEISRDAWRMDAERSGLSDYAINTLLAMFAYYEHFGLAGNPNVLTWLLGRPPTALAEFVAREL